MTAAIIPTASDPFYSLACTLDGVPFLLRFTYNQRCNVWFLDVNTTEGDPIASGLMMVCNWPLLVRCADPRKPAGFLVVTSNTTDTSPPGLLDLAPSGRCVLQYLSRADAVAAGFLPS